MTEGLLAIGFAQLIDLVVAWAMVWAGVVWLRATPDRLAFAGHGTLVAFDLPASGAE